MRSALVSRFGEERVLKFRISSVALGGSVRGIANLSRPSVCFDEHWRYGGASSATIIHRRRTAWKTSRHSLVVKVTLQRQSSFAPRHSRFGSRNWVSTILTLRGTFKPWLYLRGIRGRAMRQSSCTEKRLPPTNTREDLSLSTACSC